MSEREEHDTQKRLAPINESLIIDTIRIEAERRQKAQDEKDEKARERQAAHDRQMLRVTQGLLIATMLTGIAALYQAHASSVGANAAKGAAKAASDQVTLMKQQLEAATGAVLLFTPPNPSPDGRFYVTFSNLGNSMATDIHATARLSLNSVPGNHTIKQFDELRAPISNIGPARVNEPNSNVNRFSWDTILPFSGRETRDIESGKLIVTTNLSLSYNDGFRVITDNVCYASLRFTIELRRADDRGQESAEYRRNVPCTQLPIEIAEMYRQRLEIEQRRAERKKDDAKQK